MKINKTRIASVCVSLTLLVGISSFTNRVLAASNNQNNYTRIFGQNRYETSVDISKKGWSDGANYAVIVNGEKYSDSFCAVPLAKANNAPILLAEKNSINPQILSELKRLGVKCIYLIGGESDISKKVEEQLKFQITSKVERIYGNDKYETSIKIAEKLGDTSKAILVSDKGYADSLSAAPMAAIEGIPILVTSTEYLPKSVDNYIKSHNVTKTYVIGGTASVSNSVESLVPNPQRIGGEDRYETNINVMNSFLKDFDFNNVYAVSSGSNLENEFVDSLGASALAAKTNSPMILLGKELQDYTQGFVSSNLFPSSKVTVLAGENNIPDSIVKKLKVESKSLDIDNKTYVDNINGNAHVTGDNIIFKGDISENLYIEGNNSTISNTVVKGTIFIDPGKDEVTTLDSVTAKRIVILSGTKDGIHLKDVKSDTLVIRSENNVKIVLEDKTKILNTIVASQCTLENTSGDFGDITITGLSIDKPVTFSGGFGKSVIVESSAMVKTLEDTIIPQLYVNPTGAGKRVILGGTFKNIEVNGNTDIIMDSSLKVTDNIFIKSASTISGTENAFINNMDISPVNRDIVSLSGNFGKTPIKINTNAEINVKFGALIRLINVDKKATLVKINVFKGAELQEVRGEAVVTGEGSDITIKPED